MANAINTLLNAVGAALCGAVSWLPGWAGLLVLAVLFSALSLVVFKRTSDQEAIMASKGRVKARLMGVWLFRRDPVVAMKSLLLGFVGSLANVRFLARPMAVLFIPLFVLFVQLDHRLGVRGLAVRESATLRIHLREGADPDLVSVSSVPGVAVESAGVRVRDPDAGLFEVDYRVRAREVGGHELAVRVEPFAATKAVVVGRSIALKSPERPGGLLGGLLNPAEPTLPGDSPLTRIELLYEPAFYVFLGITWAWWTLFLVFMIFGLFLLKKPLGVEF